MDTGANQPPPLENWNLFRSDPALRIGLQAAGAEWALETADAFGRVLGQPEMMATGSDANRFPPEFRSHDRFGERIDQVDFHPAWHRLMETAISHGLHSLPWEADLVGGHTARAVLFYLASQNEAGHGCPISMTYASVPTIRLEPKLADEWEPLVVSRNYAPDPAPVRMKPSALIGMAMTERQGGTDVRANVTAAYPIGAGGSGAEYRVTGHKWFCSAPMCDAFLILAHAPRGLSCFLLPRWRPDDSRNGFHIDRLKDKLGNRSNASSEVRFENAFAWLIGEEGRGVQTIMEMVSHTRLDCVTGSAALMRRAAAEAANHTRYRQVFGRPLIEHDLMRAVLADLALETEAASALMLRVARAFDEAPSDPAADALRRVVTPVAKFWVTKRCTPVVVEALECLGGNGYVEESIMPRLFRESPLNSIWEGSGNVIVLDALRALRKNPDVVDLLAHDVADVAGSYPELDVAVSAMLAGLRSPSLDEARGREVVGHIAQTVAATSLVRHAPADVAGAYVRSRLGDRPPVTLGALEPDLVTDSLIDRIAAMA